MGRILILEDDASMRLLLDEIVRKHVSDLAPPDFIETEAEFRMQWLPAQSRDKRKRPDIFIIDVMLRWTDPAPDQPSRPPDAIEGGFMRAGLRCLNAIRQHPALYNTPVIILTSLTKKNLEDLGARPESLPRVEVLQKGDLEQLPARIRMALASSRP